MRPFKNKKQRLRARRRAARVKRPVSSPNIYVAPLVAVLCVASVASVASVAVKRWSCCSLAVFVLLGVVIGADPAAFGCCARNVVVCVCRCGYVVSF